MSEPPSSGDQASEEALRREAPHAAGGRRAFGATLAFPLSIGLAICVLSIAAGYWLRAQENRALARATAAARQHVANEVQGRFEDQVEALVRMGARWDRSGAPSRSTWEDDARRLAQDFGIIKAISWVDRSFRVRWVQPLAGNEGVAGSDLGNEERRRRAFEAARDRHQAAISYPVDLLDGDRGIVIYVPLYPQGEFDGFVTGVYRTGSALGAILRNVAPGFEVRISDGHRPLWNRRLAGVAPAGSLPIRAPVQNREWTFEVLPGTEIVETYRTLLPWLVAIGGAVTGFCLAYTLQLARIRRWRAAELLRVNVQLTDEMQRRARAEAAEREAWKELREVANSLPDHVWSANVSPAGALEPRYYSDGVERISGRPKESFLAEPSRWLELVHPAERERVAAAYAGVLRGPDAGFSLEYRIRRPDGELRWVRDRVRATSSAGERRIDGVVSDISEMKRAETERIELESRSQQAQRLESLGVLASGIAHDFNNLLTGVIGHAHLGMQELPPDAPLQARLRRIERAGQRAAELCRQMLAYTGKGSLLVEPLDLRAVVTEMGELLRSTIPKKISLRYDLGEDLPPVEADATQLRQVVMNLITNASEAIGDATGQIEVSVRAVECGRAELEAADLVAGLEPGPCVALAVKDDGAGMDAATRMRIFEPFYTTKFAGRGLGMAAVLGILRGHRGAIRVRSEPGRGTEITLLLPAGCSQPAAAQPKAGAPAWRGSGTLLVVDDEEAAREMAAHTLRRAGFRVLTASDGPAAIELFRAHEGEIRCVLLDLTMPRMDGCDVHRRLRQIDPGVPVVLCSGYPEPEAMERFASLDLSGFLEKPYTPEVLSRAIREALEERAGQSRVAAGEQAALP